MVKYILEFNKNDIEDFIYRANRQNPVRKFWKAFIHSLPDNLRDELKNKPTRLFYNFWKKFYAFETENASKELFGNINNIVIVAKEELGLYSKSHENFL